jgi:hypothetical protein
LGVQEAGYSGEDRFDKLRENPHSDHQKEDDQSCLFAAVSRGDAALERIKVQSGDTGQIRTQHKAKQQKHGGEAEQADRYGKGHIMDIADAGAGGVLIKSNGHDGKHVGNGGHSA